MNDQTRVSPRSLCTLGSLLVASVCALGSVTPGCSSAGTSTDGAAASAESPADPSSAVTSAADSVAGSGTSNAKSGSAGAGTVATAPGAPGSNAATAAATPGNPPGASGSATGAAGATGATAANGAAAGSDAMAAAGATGESEAPAVTCEVPESTDTDPCTAPLKPGDDRLCEMTINGQERKFYIYASPKFDPCTPASLIMDCHGASESIDVHTGREGFNLSGQMFPGGYGSFWHRAVQEDNAIIVTPEGTGLMWSPMRDIPFVNGAADQVEKIAKVDPERVYVTGISMGGMQTVATGCDDANRWRGMAPVAMLTQSCAKLDRPTPTISFHAMGDQLTNYDQDRATMESIAAHNNCKQGPTDGVQYGGPMSSPDPVCITRSNNVGDPDAPDRFTYPLAMCEASVATTKCVEWTQCDDGVEVVFCTVAAGEQPIGGHILYANDTHLALGVVAWNFFKKFWK